MQPVLSLQTELIKTQSNKGLVHGGWNKRVHSGARCSRLLNLQQPITGFGAREIGSNTIGSESWMIEEIAWAAKWVWDWF